MNTLAARARLKRKFDQQNGLCFYCGRITQLAAEIKHGGRVSSIAATREHLVKRADGGKNDDANVVVACQGCNATRGDRTPEQMFSCPP